MNILELTDEQLRFLHIMVDDYTPTDEDEEVLKDSIAEKLPFIYTCGFSKNIPKDYSGAMGVPITFLNK